MKDVNKFVEQKNWPSVCSQARHVKNCFLLIKTTFFGQIGDSVPQQQLENVFSDIVIMSKLTNVGCVDRRAQDLPFQGPLPSLFIIKTTHKKRVYLFCVKIWFKVGSKN